MSDKKQETIVTGVAEATDVAKVAIAAKAAVTAEELLILVDRKDRQIGVGEKLAVHRAGQLHRAFSVFILRSNTVGAVDSSELEVLLQQRHKNKYHCGELWSNTCCSHPRVGEEVQDAAARRLQEEMGITARLHSIGSFCYRAEFSNGLIEHELDHTYIGIYDASADTPINFNPEEVQAIKWMKIVDLRRDLTINKQHYTPWLAPALNLVERNYSTCLRIGF